MSGKRRIGVYRHEPGNETRVDRDGQVYHSRVRRRFPHLPLVFFCSAGLAPLTALLLDAVVKLMPMKVSLANVSGTGNPGVGLNNLLFGMGVPELALAGGLAGVWLWRGLWNVRTGHPDGRPPLPQAVALLLPRAVPRGILAVGLALAVAQVGAYLRTAPPEQPWLVRPLFGLLSIPVVGVTALLTWVLPLLALAAGVAIGSVFALAIAATWRHFPEEGAAG